MGKPKLRIITSILLATLLLSVLTPTLISQSPILPAQAAVNYSGGSAAEIQTLINNVASHGGWLQSPQICYDGIVLGQTNVSQLQKVVDDLNRPSSVDWMQIFYWYYVMQKFDVSINQTTIKAALDATPMMQNKLPKTDNSQGYPAFSVYDRYMVYAYTLADSLNYDTAKWDLNTAYNSFKTAVDNFKPPLWVKNDTSASGNGRYYDEGGQTVQMFLEFYKAGITEALSEAEKWWEWTNTNLWNTLTSEEGMFYQYSLSREDFECEVGGFNQIIWELYHYNPDTANTNNLLIDLQTRLLSSQWDSPQWLKYVIVHAGLGVNTQTRLQNTITSWAAMLGLTPLMTDSMKATMQEMLNGNNSTNLPAWALLKRSSLYHSGMFSQTSNVNASPEATANAACLMMYLSMVPVNGSVAVPIQDLRYEDVNNIIDGEISNINLTSNQLTVSVLNPGVFNFLYGSSPVTYDLPTSGTWLLTFASDCNSIENATLLSSLPSSRIYLSADITAKSTYTITALADDHCQIAPSGTLTVHEGDAASFVFTPNRGCVITEIIINGDQIVNGSGQEKGSYMFSNVHANQNITVYSSTFPVSSSNSTATTTPTATITPTASPTNKPDDAKLFIGLSIATSGAIAGLVLIFYLRSRKEEPVEI
ncbi:MAG: hypothetical protein NWF01_00670 [Candidatus Bathyarchaeota archaeon]|nr:hypothetical protein [Candidatus Bathyarchaeota archaeon]